ncbi:MAG: histidine phosphatase family protein [Rhodospirillales bacterium]|nr:histidine phosphatase family protein [Rhodospirillales bacterium]
MTAYAKPKAGMTKTLFLLRHAKSSWKETGLEDFDRSLNRRGRAAATAIGQYLAEANIAPAQILCSSAKRTRETLERVQGALTTAVPTRFERGIYLAEAPALLRRIKRLSDSLASVMIVGHNPGLEILAEMLINDGDESLRQALAAKFPTGSLCIIKADVVHWAEFKARCGQLVAFVCPRQLIGE